MSEQPQTTTDPLDPPAAPEPTEYDWTSDDQQETTPFHRPV
jgi:hypothetical protein